MADVVQVMREANEPLIRDIRQLVESQNRVVERLDVMIGSLEDVFDAVAGREIQLGTLLRPILQEYQLTPKPLHLTESSSDCN